MPESHSEIAVFAGGCFWCMEAVFDLLPGIIQLVPAYAGGNTSNPRYEQVCAGDTGHAEVIHITFDPKQISYLDLLKIFFVAHNPCTINQQGADIGSQYRSAIFYANEKQKEIASTYIKQLSQKGIYQDPIVTELLPLTTFYPAEEYHHKYYSKHPDQAYCQISIKSKVNKIKKLIETDGQSKTDDAN